MKKRNISSQLCNYCGSSYSVYFDKNNNELICSECLTEESCIRDEVISSYEFKEIKSFKDFENFFIEVDKQNAYEDSWSKKKENLKPIYKRIYLELTKG